MKEISCNVIKDLLPLYIDKVLSEESVSLVEEHLETCEECKKEYEDMKRNVDFSVALDMEKSEKNVFKEIKKKFFRKKVLIALTSFFVSAALLLGVHAILTFPLIYIPYDSQKMKVVIEDDKVYMKCEYNDFEKIVGTEPYKVGNDNVIVFYLENSIINQSGIGNKGKKIEDMYYLGEADEIDKVYYGEFSDEEFSNSKETIVNKTELVWSK